MRGRKPPFFFVYFALESNPKQFQTYMSKVELESRSLLLGSVTLLEGKIMTWNNIDLAEGLALLSANGYWLKGTSAKPVKRLTGTNKVVW